MEKTQKKLEVDGKPEHKRTHVRTHKLADGPPENIMPRGPPILNWWRLETYTAQKKRQPVFIPQASFLFGG